MFRVIYIGPIKFKFKTIGTCKRILKNRRIQDEICSSEITYLGKGWRTSLSQISCSRLFTQTLYRLYTYKQVCLKHYIFIVNAIFERYFNLFSTFFLHFRLIFTLTTLSILLGSIFAQFIYGAYVRRFLINNQIHVNNYKTKEKTQRFCFPFKSLIRRHMVLNSSKYLNGQFSIHKYLLHFDVFIIIDNYRAQRFKSNFN